MTTPRLVGPGSFRAQNPAVETAKRLFVQVAGADLCQIADVAPLAQNCYGNLLTHTEASYLHTQPPSSLGRSDPGNAHLNSTFIGALRRDCDLIAAQASLAWVALLPGSGRALLR